MCSLSDLVGLNPADLLTKLRMLFGVVIGLCCIMTAGAALGFGLDAHERRNVLAKLQTPELGFRVTLEGAWLWRFTVEPLRDDQDAPTGTAVALAELLGVPYSRLRAALPDELVGFGMCDVMGRRHVLSKTALEAAMVTQRTTKFLPAAVYVEPSKQPAATNPPPQRRPSPLPQGMKHAAATPPLQDAARSPPLYAASAPPSTRRARLLAELGNEGACPLRIPRNRTARTARSPATSTATTTSKTSM